MSRPKGRVDLIRKEIVKRELKKGVSAKGALLKAKYSYSTANHSTSTPVIKVCQMEILEELRAKDITIDLVIKRLNQDRDGALSKGDYATATKVDELLGKYLAMFTDRKEITATVFNDIEKRILDKYISPNRLKDIPENLLEDKNLT